MYIYIYTSKLYYPRERCLFVRIRRRDAIKIPFASTLHNLFTNKTTAELCSRIRLQQAQHYRRFRSLTYLKIYECCTRGRTLNHGTFFSAVIARKYLPLAVELFE